MTTETRAQRPDAAAAVAVPDRPPRRRRRPTPRTVLLGVVLCFVLCAAAVLSLTPPWEANDEPDHVINVETLASGHMYDITPYNDGNLESIQAPLYYMVLAAYQRAIGEPVQPAVVEFAPASVALAKKGNFVHTIPSDGLSQRFVDLLRLPSVLFGALTVLLTYLAARRITADRWTPVVAAAIVAGVPKFVFVSGVINNDNLSNVLGGAALLAALTLLARPPTSKRMMVFAGAGLGLLGGALVLTKVTGGLLIPGLLVALWLVARRGADWLTMFGSFVVGALLVCGWWLVYNQIHYGDPLALQAIDVHQRATFPYVFNIPSAPKQLLVEVPKTLYSTFWYDSGSNQFYWHWYWYLPFWFLAAIGIVGLARRSAKPLASHAAATLAPARHALAVCATIALGGLASVWVIGAQANTEQGRYAFMALPAIGILIALGYERLRIWPPLRFALPLIGLVGVVLAVRYDVIGAYAVNPYTPPK